MKPSSPQDSSSSWLLGAAASHSLLRQAPDTRRSCFSSATTVVAFMLQLLVPRDHAIVMHGDTAPSAPSHCHHLLRASAPCSQCFSQLLPISKATSVSRKPNIPFLNSSIVFSKACSVIYLRIYHSEFHYRISSLKY